MAENKFYMAVGEETNRGTAETTTVGFIPLLDPGGLGYQPDDQVRKEYRGEKSALGDTSVRRMSQKWSRPISIPFFTEAGTTKGIMGTLIKHFFGKVSGGQNGTTGQYYWMFYPIENPYDSANLGNRALTLNTNFNHGAVMKNHPLVGGRPKSIEFSQEPGQLLKFTEEFFGQYIASLASEIGNPTFAAENLRCNYNNLKCYTGTITRTGTAPNYTNFSFGSATQFKPDKLSIKFEDVREDKLRLAGLDYPDKTVNNKFLVTVSFDIDWEDPASGFSSSAQFRNWLSAITETNFFFHWNTGTQAGSGDNHSLYIDLPRVYSKGLEDPKFDLDKDPIITLKYEGLMDLTTTQYQGGLMLKNTASAV